jgi:hypothetical protein
MTYIPQNHRQFVAAAAELPQPAASPGCRLRWRPRSGWRRLGAPAVAAILAVLVPAVVATALVVGHHDSLELLGPGQQGTPTIDNAPIPAAGTPPAAALVQRFGVLGSAQHPGDSLPADRTVNAPPFYADQVHHVTPTAPLDGPGRTAPGDVYIAGGSDDRVCLVVLPVLEPGPSGPTGPAGECHGLAMATKGMTFLTMERDGGAEVDVFGIVPDGVATVNLTLADGRRSTLPVHDNVYSVEVVGTPRSIGFTGSAGPVDVHVG